MFKNKLHLNNGYNYDTMVKAFLVLLLVKAVIFKFIIIASKCEVFTGLIKSRLWFA